MWPRRKKDKWHATVGEGAFTFLAKGARFKGTLSLEGTVRIDGRLEGEIHTKGTVIIGEAAIIEGDVNADAVISGGRVTGNIVASKKVELLAPGSLIGTIKTPLLSLEEGVAFSGNCEAEGRGELRALEEVRGPAGQSAPARGAS
jgi:cytoskeletal protein CcmA (bactofilin family)